MKKTVLIMAGGRGERFWPKSRKNLPKQFLSLTDDNKTMIQLTVERILPLVAVEDIFVATNKDYKALVREQLPEIPEENIICEPIGRNTAPCIGLGAIHIQKKYGEALMMVLPSDHLIRSVDLFVGNLEKACDLAESGSNLVTMGITPQTPETGYGYIKFKSQLRVGDAYPVVKFVEKPTLAKAKEYLADGRYLWNSGMFIWKVSTILKNIREYLPEVYEGLKEIQKSLGTENEEEIVNTVFETMKSESIDYGVMEKADNIYTIPGSFGWDDVGSWLAVSRLGKADDFGNVVSPNTVTIDTESTIVQGHGKLIATLGVKNLIVVDTPDATLICNKSFAGDIKKVVEVLKNSELEEYL